MHRRAFLGRLAGVAGVAMVAPQLLRQTSVGAAVVAGPGPYGALGAVDANGLMLPAGFTSRVIARTGQAVATTGYSWHLAPDGGACFAAPGGGWVYVSNSEAVNAGAGGASAVRFATDASITSAYRVLTGSTHNCAGGPTPWGTWLSCEENGSAGRVYECNPLGGQGVQRPLLGSFSHEAAAVDAVTGHVYLTEDDPAGRLYRFVPTTPGDLATGTLQAASVSGTSVTWLTTSTNAPDRAAATASFNGGEGAWISGRTLWFTTKGNGRVYELDLTTQQLTVLYDPATTAGAPLTGVDNITAHAPSGDLYVAEDGGNMEICLITTADAQDTVAPFLRIIGHAGSEITGPAFSPDGTRLYFSSQRGTDGTTGVTYEVTGPFRTGGGPPPPPPTMPVVVAADVFGRSVSGGWGAADVGGAWTLTGGAASAYSVSGGAGRMVATAGGSRAMSLNGLVVDDVDATVDVALDKAPTGGGTSVSLLARKVGTSDYRLRTYLRAGNLLQLVRMVNGVETALGTVNLSVPGGSYVPGQVVHMRLKAEGSGPTTLSGKVWFGAAAEPSAWMIQATDATAALQGTGGTGLYVYESSSATNAPVTVSCDNLQATTPAP